MRVLIITVLSTFLLFSPDTSSGQSGCIQPIIVEYGPAPAYRITGLHRLVPDPTGCQIRRYSGTVVRVETNPYFKIATDGGVMMSAFTIKTSRGKRITFHFKDPLFPGVPAQKVIEFIAKGRTVEVRAYQCQALLADSVETPKKDN